MIYSVISIWYNIIKDWFGIFSFIQCDSFQLSNNWKVSIRENKDKGAHPWKKKEKKKACSATNCCEGKWTLTAPIVSVWNMPALTLKFKDIQRYTPF